MEEDEQDEEETEGNDWEDDCVPRGEPISSSSSSAATGDSEEEEEDLQDDIEEGDEEDLASVKSEADMDIAEEFENSPLPPKQREPKQHIKKDLLKKPRGRPSSTTASSQVVLLSKCSSLLGLEPAVPLEETEFTDYLPELQTGARLPIISYTRKGTETTGDSRSRLGVDRLEAIPSMTYAPNKPIPKAAFVKLDRDSSIIPPLVASSLSSPVRSPTSGTQLPRLLPGLGSPGRRRASKDTRNATYVTYKCTTLHEVLKLT